MSFADDTAVVDEGDGRFGTTICPGWDIAGNANGGYLLCLAARAMALAAGRPDPVTVTAHYLSPGHPGPATVSTEVVKQGRTFATATGALEAGGRRLLQSVGTFGEAAESPPSSSVLTPSRRSCRRRRTASRSSPATISRRRSWVGSIYGCTRTTPASRPGFRAANREVRGWFRLRDGEPVDTLALLLAVDAFPPTAFNARLPVAWTPTVELTAHVRARPAPGWMRCAFTTRFVTGGFLEEDGEIWDATDRLVAQSRQLALVPRA